ncbi:MAG TPA: alkene reductase [bacterium]|jgi:N-ethylmaleimide reductase|nr:alkene reductase [bacterium]
MRLLSPFKLGPLELPNRMTMSALTRCRAVEGNVPNPLAVTYYAQRASAGLIVSEATQVTPLGQGYPHTPGIHSDEQVKGWIKVTDAVHQAGGRIFLQLWHVGRVSHPDFHNGQLPVAPSALPVEGELFTPLGKKKIETPRALEFSEIPQVVEQFKKGAENAMAAGFDGVEIHGANGYLLDQFTKSGANHRADAYGGSLMNRLRFPLEVADAVIGVWGPERVGYKVAPLFDNYSMSDADPVETFTHLSRELNRLKLAYLCIAEGVAGPRKPPAGTVLLTPLLRQVFHQAYMVNGGYDAPLGNEIIGKGGADLVSYGTLFLANPDLPERFKQGAPLNPANPATYYGGTEKGYTDYPPLGG